MREKRKKKNLSEFIVYTMFIFTLTILCVSHLKVKMEIQKTQFEIERLHQIKISNVNIVKELQSNKEFLMSEKYISDFLSNEMSVVIPETIIIEVQVTK